MFFFFFFVCFFHFLTAAAGSRLFDSVVRALDFYPGRPGSNPTTGGSFYQLCLISLLRLSCRKIGGSSGIGLYYAENGFASS